MIQAKVIADSRAWTGARLTTMIVTFPRFILAEFNTHRVFSRNSASSRAIPFAKMVKMVKENPFIPIAWQKDHKGMQGVEYFTDAREIEARKSIWLSARDTAVEHAEALNGKSFDLGTGKSPKVELMSEIGVTKQLCNRLLEPFMWHTVIVSATQFENFFELRCPKYDIDGIPYRSKKDAQTHDIKRVAHYEQLHWLQANKGQSEIHMMALAEAIWDAYNESVPKVLKPGEWHVPFGDNIDESEIFSRTVFDDGSIMDSKLSPFNFKNSGGAKHWYQTQKVKIATARCARISYQTLGDDPKVDYSADIKLHNMLAESGHWSPFEHCARTMMSDEYNTYIKGKVFVDLTEDDDEDKICYDEDSFGWCNNFKGFIQYRAMLEENN